MNARCRRRCRDVAENAPDRNPILHARAPHVGIGGQPVAHIRLLQLMKADGANLLVLVRDVPHWLVRLWMHHTKSPREVVVRRYWWDVEETLEVALAD